MSAEYSVGQILAHAKLIREREHPSICNDDAADMLESYAERIEADESAVACGYLIAWRDPTYRGKQTLSFDRRRKYDGTFVPVFTHPPAQAAQSGCCEWCPVGKLGGTAEPVTEHPDDAAVDAFASAMKAKLAVARAKGRGGWQDKADCPQQRLSDMLRAHVEKGDPCDVANFCMFLHQRGETILSAEPVAQGEAVAWRIDYADGSRITVYEKPEPSMFDAMRAPITPLYDHSTPPASPVGVPDGINGQALELLVAGGFVTRAKAAHAIDAHLAQPAQSVDVGDAMVERMAKWMCRNEVGDSETLDEVVYRMTKWERYKDEAKSALTAALTEKGNG